jgi:N-acetylglutamate synthase-like GNAT family acetyltransferase
MSSPDYTLRRATVDDLVGLKQLWERAHLQVLDLEKRLTEFQLVGTEAGDLVGAIGLQIDGKQGRIHSEAFAQPEDTDRFRQQLWERIQAVARNHGLVRLWTREPAPFWAQRGFQEADAETIKKLPPAFGDTGQRWSSLQLKEESPVVISLDKEFELFQASQREGVERIMRQAKIMKNIAYAILGIVVLIGGFYLLYVLIKNPGLPIPGPK